MIQTWTFWLIVAVAPPIYWSLPLRLRGPFLGLCSLGCIAVVAPVSLACLVGLSTLCFASFRLVRAHRARVVTAVGLVAGMVAWLVYCKLGFGRSFSEGEWLAPLGVSYYVFRLVHYTIECARGRFREVEAGDFAAYILCFPIFTAGPIERLDHFIQNREGTWSSGQWVAGVTRIAVGLIKQFVIVDLLLAAVIAPHDYVQGFIRRLDEIAAWQAWVFSYVQLVSMYVSFSACTDIAIGVCRLFGIGIAENFNRPLLAHNVAEFWRRWHMTLVGFVQSYVYMPLVGYTRSPYLATAVTFAVIGAWHGFTLNWLLWGMYNAAGVMVHAAWVRGRPRRRMAGWTPARVVGILATHVFATVGYVLVYTDKAGVDGACRVLARMFGVG